MQRRNVRWHCRLVAAMIFLGLPLAAQEPADVETTAAPSPSIARNSAAPVDAVRGFIDACREGDYATAAGYLVLDGIPEDQRTDLGPRYARQFKIVLDRKLWVQYELLSDRPEGDLGDGLPDHIERLGKIDGFEALLERVPDDRGDLRWKIASGTVDSIPMLYERHGLGPLGEVLPAPLMDVAFLELRLWQWIGLVLLLAGAVAGAWILAIVIHRIGRAIVGRTETTLDDLLLDRLIGPLRFLLVVVLFTAGTVPLALSVPAYGFLSKLEIAAAVLAFAWGLLRGVDVAAERAIERLEREERRNLISVVLLGSRIGKTVLLALATVALLQNIGFNVTGLVAGLGVGGLALALAAQKSIANLFGGVSLVADQPIRVGDFCKFGDNKMGTVEEIGIRSTRVRTLERTVVTIPNAEFSEMQLENFGARDQIRLHTFLTLRYETSPDQLRRVLVELRKLLVSHPKIAELPARVRLVGFGASSLDVEFFGYVETADWSEFLQVREDIYLRIMDVLEECGTGFAYPSQTLYLGRDGGLDEDAARRAESDVRAWRESGKLPFPDLDATTLAEIDGTLDYPPRGSVSDKPDPST